MNVVIFGPPGAGKGTQSQLISEKIKLAHVSTGDLLRQAVKEQTPLGLEAKKYMDQGALVPDGIMIGLIKEVMAKASGKGILLDGFPRTVVQAEALDEFLENENTQIDKAVFLEVARDLLKDRLSGRRSCKNCGSTYHVKLKPPKKENVCNQCGHTLEQRPDDKPDVIGNRLDVYEKNTAPLKAYFQGKNKFVSVDGVGEPLRVFERIKSVLS